MDCVRRAKAAGLRVGVTFRAKLSSIRTVLLYESHRDKPHFPGLISSTSGSVVGVVLIGPHAVARWRALLGATDPTKAAPGNIRATWGTELPHNAAHGSDSPEAAEREIHILFRRFA